MNTTFRVAALSLMSVAVLAGCKKNTKETPPPPAVEPPPAMTQPVETSGLYGPSDLDTDACLRQRVVYFDLDQDSLKPEFQAIMRATPSTCVTVLRPGSTWKATPTSAVRASTTWAWASVAATRFPPPCRPPAVRVRSCRW